MCFRYLLDILRNINQKICGTTRFLKLKATLDQRYLQRIGKVDHRNIQHAPKQSWNTKFLTTNYAPTLSFFYNIAE